MATALLIARILVGAAFFGHGAQKLFGWFGGYGIKGTGGFFEQLGFRPGTLFAVAAGLGEIGGGTLTALGLGGPLGPALIVMVMLVAMFSVHLPNGFWQSANGYELNTMNIAAALVLGFTGPGPLSLDTAFAIDGIWTDEMRWIAFGAAVVLAGANLLVRRPAHSTQTAQN
jgi:putative oxidoreductase